MADKTEWLDAATQSSEGPIYVFDPLKIRRAVLSSEC